MRMLGLVVALSVVVSLPAYAETDEEVFHKYLRHLEKVELLVYLTYGARRTAAIDYPKLRSLARQLFIMDDNKLEKHLREDYVDEMDRKAWLRKLRKADRDGSLRYRVKLLEEFVRDYKAAKAR